MAYVEQLLVPTLRPGDVVVMNNLAAHKVAGVEAPIRLAGSSVLYLPPYSPKLREMAFGHFRENPIEQVFAKLKALLRGAATRTKETLWTTIGHLLGQFASGYEFT